MVAMLAVVLFFFSYTAQAQVKVFTTPGIWLRADSTGSGSYWKDLSGNAYHAYLRQGMSEADTGLFNYHPCLIFDTQEAALQIDYHAKSRTPLTIFSVYKPLGSAEELGVWSLRFDSARKLELTTRKLDYMGKENKYSDSTSCEPVLNLLKSTWKGKHVDTSQSHLYIAGSDSSGFRGKFAEFMLYDTQLNPKEILRIHTYLAIKYGINIQKFDYVNSSDTVIWDYRKDSIYSNNIGGIGKDTLMLINQKQSCGRGGDDRLTIAAGTLSPTNLQNSYMINDADYLIWGSNGKGFDTFLPGDSLSECRWMMRRTGATADAIVTQLIIHAPELSREMTLNLVIIRGADSLFSIENAELIPADSADTSRNYYFNNINWDTDHSGRDIFTFQLTDTTSARVRHLTAEAGNNSSGEYNQTADINALTIFPNPTADKYAVDIRLSRSASVKVSIVDENGKTMWENTCSGSPAYQLAGPPMKKGCYIVKAEADGHTKIAKLVIQ